MFGLFGKKDKSSVRELETPFDLKKGDIITFKPKAYLPHKLAANDFTVDKETTYQYPDGNVRELVIKGEDNRVYYMSIEPNDGDPEICISLKLPRADVMVIFDGDAFGEMFDGEYVTLDCQETPDGYDGWIADRYMQSSQAEVGFFYDKACDPDEFTPGGEEFRLYEFEGEPDHFSMSVEVYGDGTTDVLLEVSGGFDMIDQMWPGS